MENLKPVHQMCDGMELTPAEKAEIKKAKDDELEPGLKSNEAGRREPHTPYDPAEYADTINEFLK